MTRYCELAVLESCKDGFGCRLSQYQITSGSALRYQSKLVRTSSCIYANRLTIKLWGHGRDVRRLSDQKAGSETSAGKTCCMRKLEISRCSSSTVVFRRLQNGYQTTRGCSLQPAPPQLCLLSWFFSHMHSSRADYGTLKMG